MMLMMKKYIYIFLGGLFLLLGIIGIFLPLLPTTPFLILAGFCFSRGSESFHNWLLNHRFFGPPIQDWNKNGVIRLNHKLLATFMLMISAAFIYPKDNIPAIGKISFTILTLIILIFIWTRPSSPSC